MAGFVDLGRCVGEVREVIELEQPAPLSRTYAARKQRESRARRKAAKQPAPKRRRARWAKRVDDAFSER